MPAPPRAATARGAGGVLGAEGHHGHLHRRPGLRPDRGRRPAERPQAGTTRRGEARMTLARYQELVAELAAHDRRYYIDNAPVISDQDYDRLYHELRAIEAAHPDWVVPRVAHPARGPGAGVGVPEDRPRGAHAVAGQHLQPGGAAGVPGSGAPRAARRDPGVRGRAEDRRHQHRADLPAGAFRAGGHPRRRAGGRGDHHQPAHHPLAARARWPGRSTWWCGARCT